MDGGTAYLYGICYGKFDKSTGKIHPNNRGATRKTYFSPTVLVEAEAILKVHQKNLASGQFHNICLYYKHFHIAMKLINDIQITKLI